MQDLEISSNLLGAHKKLVIIMIIKNKNNIYVTKMVWMRKLHIKEESDAILKHAE